MINIRSGINRYLQCEQRVIDLSNDPEFMTANQVFAGVMKKMRKEGLDVTKHKDPIAPEDICKLYASETLSVKNPESLQNKVFFEVNLHFARRGREGLRDLRKDSFLLKTDAAGAEYVCVAYHEKEKNHPGTVSVKSSEKQAVMYTNEGDPLCPVRSFKLHLEKLHPNCPAFLQQPNKYFEKTGLWYKNCPLGINKIGVKMAEISKQAKLSTIYTNHCLRATAATVLSDSGAEGREIIAFTGHKHESSLKPYVSGPSAHRKRELSDVLHQYGKENKVSRPKTTESPPAAATAACAIPAVLPVAASTSGVGSANPSEASHTGVKRSDGLSGTLDLPKAVESGRVTSASMEVQQYTNNMESLLHGALRGAVFNGPTSINFNIYQNKWIVWNLNIKHGMWKHISSLALLCNYMVYLRLKNALCNHNGMFLTWFAIKFQETVGKFALYILMKTWVPLKADTYPAATWRKW